MTFKHGRRHEQIVHVLAADVVPNINHLTEPPPQWMRYRFVSGECPKCDQRSLATYVTAGSAVYCMNPECEAVFDECPPGCYVIDRDTVRGEPTRWHRPVVYYMRMSDLIKIGWSSNIHARFEAIGPQGVVAVEWGDRSVEYKRHQQFVDTHSHREWFRLSPELAEHMTGLREAWLEETGHDVEHWLRDQGVRV